MKKAKTVELREATMKKGKAYKFGQSLKKGDKVLIKETPIGNGRYSYSACRPDETTLFYGVIPSEFEYTGKTKFLVEVTRVSYSTKDFLVEAKTRQEAAQLADENAGSFEFREHTADYKVGMIVTEAQAKEMSLNVSLKNAEKI